MSDGKEVDAYHLEVLSWNYLQRSEAYEKLGQESSKRKGEQDPPHSHKQSSRYHTPLRALSLKDSPLEASEFWPLCYC